MNSLQRRHDDDVINSNLWYHYTDITVVDPCIYPRYGVISTTDSTDSRTI